MHAREAKETGCSELVRTLLEKRGVSDAENMRAFLFPDYAAHAHDPFLMRDMRVAVDRFFSAIERNERIAIYADFDCDGIPGAALLSDLFKKISYDNFEVYIPHRDREGYGLHEDALRALKGRGVALVVTVDVGTVARDAIAFCNSIGLDVIVTDHHEILPAGDRAPELPDAVAILNPKIAPYPFHHLCGAGVAFKFAQAILSEGRARDLPAFAAVPDGWEKWLLDLVAIATVADMVPLIGENRVLAFWGLHVLRKSERPGIAALCGEARVKKGELTETDIGFAIAPRVNAASRMDDPDLAFKLLTTKSRSEAESLAEKLEELNASRKGIVGSIVREAKKRAAARHAPGDRVIVLGDASWKPALLGLAANSIVQEFGGVACLWGRDANGNLKGSCRSDGAIGIPDLFSAARDSFIECGGHNASGGFSVSFERVHSLQEDLARAARAIPLAQKPEARAAHDAVIALREASMPLFKDVSRLAPFGIENPKPVFRIGRVQVLAVKRFGKEKNHVEILVTCLDTGCSMRAFEFFKSEQDFTHVPRERDEVAILATIERDSFRGPERLALRLVDVLAA